MANYNRKYYFYFALLCVLVIATYVLVVAYKATFNISSDFVTFYESGKSLLNGTGGYQPEDWTRYATTPHVAVQVDPKEFAALHYSGNMNPPLVNLILSGLSRLNFGLGYVLFSLFSMLCAFIGLFFFNLRCDLALLSTKEGPPGLLSNKTGIPSFLILSFLYWSFFPNYSNISYGQFGGIVFLLAVGLWYCDYQKQMKTAGLILGIACHIKLFFLLFGFYYFLQREWRLLFIALIVGLLLAAAGLFLCGQQPYFDYYQALHTVTWYGSSENASLVGFFTRLLGGSINRPLVYHPKLASGLIIGFAVVLVLTLMNVIANFRRRRAFPVFARDVTFSLTIVIMLLVSPLGWRYYFGILFIPFYTLLKALELPLSDRPWIFRSLCLSVFCAGFPGTIISRAKEVAALDLLTKYASGFYTLCFLLIGLLLVSRYLIAYSKDRVLWDSALTKEKALVLYFCWLPSLLGIFAILIKVGLLWPL